MREGFFYLASPYTLFRGGFVCASAMAARVAGQFVRAGIPIFSPIAHSHAITTAGHLDPTDGVTWMLMDAPLMEAAKGLVVLKADGWEESKGIADEMEYFRVRHRPIYFLETDNLDPEYLRSRFAHL